MPPLWDVDFKIAGGNGRINSGDDRFKISFDAWPTRCAQHDNSYTAGRQVLLALEMGIGGDQYCEASQFRGLKKLAIL